MFKKFFKRFIFKFYESKLKRFLRLSSGPYVSGDSIRKQCEHVFDEDKGINPRKIKENQSIFVKTDMIEKFFAEIHPKIKFKYFLITHNSDLSISKQEYKLSDNKVIHWFAQNLEEKMGENISILPIGLENRWRFNNGKIRYFKKFTKKKINKSNLILSCFSITTNKDRRKIYEVIENNENIKNISSISPKKYRSLLSQSMFNICPEGNGLDTHRIWESFALKSIPIVLINNFTIQFKDLGIPMLYLESWDELNNFDEKFYLNFYQKTSSANDLNKFSTISFWNDYMESSK